MKFYSFFLSLILAIAPVYSYALLPVAVNIGVAIAGSKSGRVAIQNGTGAVIKKVSPTAKQGLIKNAIALCKANVLAMKACSDILGDMLDDDVHIENKTTVNNDIDVEIYRRIFNKCRVVPVFGKQGEKFSSYHGAYSYYSSKLENKMRERTYLRNIKDVSPQSENKSRLDRFLDRIKMINVDSLDDDKIYHISDEYYASITYTYEVRDGDKESGFWYGSRIGDSFKFFYQKRCESGDKDYLSDDEIEEYFNKRADGDDITNIYNYDYSKHDNITINNKTESGDTINNYKNDFDKTEKEKNVSANATEKMKNKRKGYDIDEINDENCEKNEKGEYDKCGDDRGKKDGEDSESEEESKKEDEKKEDDEEDKPIDCKASSFHKKVCDWIDWTQEEHDPKQNTKVDIDEPDLPNIDEDRIKFKAVCPPPKPIHINVVGRDYHTELSYQPLCDFFSELKPFVVGLGWFSGAMIIAGRRY